MFLQHKKVSRLVYVPQADKKKTLQNAGALRWSKFNPATSRLIVVVLISMYWGFAYHFVSTFTRFDLYR